MPGKRISELTALSGAASANNDDLVVFDADAGETKRISRSQLAEGMQADVQVFTNKTINLGSNTLTGTTVQFNTALSDNNFATQAGSETLTNKTIALANNTVNYTQGGTGSQQRTVENKLQEFVSVKDFGAVGDGVADDTAAFNAAASAAGTSAIFVPSGSYAITGSITSGSFYSFGVVTIVGGSVAVTDRSVPAVTQGRARINYHSTTQVKAYVPENIVMAGFRFMGSYKKGRGTYLSTGVGSNGFVVVGGTSDLAFETSYHAANWYGVFAASNETDTTATFKQVPFFRAGSLAGNVITLAEGGETNGDTITTTTYTMSTDALVGCEVLIIQENKQFSGKTTTVTANTNGTVTLADVGSMAAGDFFLVSPPSYDNYCYMGSWYCDNTGGEPRNMADALQEVSSYGINIPTVPASGEIATATRYPLAGLVSPLSTGYIFSLTFSLQTSSTGTVSHTIWHDSSSHQTFSSFVTKYSSTSETYVEPTTKVMFSGEQAIWLSTGSTLDANVTFRAIKTLGWIEM